MKLSCRLFQNSIQNRSVPFSINWRPRRIINFALVWYCCVLCDTVYYGILLLDNSSIQVHLLKFSFYIRALNFLTGWTTTSNAASCRCMYYSCQELLSGGELIIHKFYPHYIYSNISDHELNCAVMMWTQLKHRHLRHAAKSVSLPDECITTILWSVNIDTEDGSEKHGFDREGGDEEGKYLWFLVSSQHAPMKILFLSCHLEGLPCCHYSH